MKQVEKVILWKNNQRARRVYFDGKNHANGNLMEENYASVREKMGTNFLGSPDLMDLTAFSHAVGNGRENPCIPHIIKYTIEYESN